MKDPGNIANTTGIYPDVLFQDIVAPGDGLGTPAVKDWVQDLIGWPQALLNYVGEIPDGNNETGSASQLLTALKQLGIHPGVVLPLHLNDDPANFTNPPRLILLEGQGVLRSDYSELDAATWVGSGTNGTAPAYYRATDAAGTSRNINGSYLILPDMRGLGVRGLDLLASVDPQGASRSLGDLQASTVEEHSHAITRSVNNPVAVAAGPYTNYQIEPIQTNATAGGSLLLANVVASPTNPIIDTTSVTSPTGNYGTAGADTHMANAAVSWAIVY